MEDNYRLLRLMPLQLKPETIMTMICGLDIYEWLFCCALYTSTADIFLFSYYDEDLKAVWQSC